MSKDWRSTLNIASVPAGTERSILGYAGESLVIGRALLCGYNLFFKAWRDSKYDAVLDHAGVLYRIEIKQSRDGEEFSLTSGGRSGVQIDRAAKSREQVMSADDSDFLVAVHSLTGRCWIVPTEVVSILGRRSVKVGAISEFEEAWAIFALLPKIMGSVANPSQLRNLDLPTLKTIGDKIGLVDQLPDSWVLGKRAVVRLESDLDRYVIAIWRRLALMTREPKTT